MRNLETEAKPVKRLCRRVPREEIPPEAPVLRRRESFQYPVGQQKTQTKKLFPQESIRV
jgi:hypothetical protein